MKARRQFCTWCAAALLLFAGSVRAADDAAALIKQGDVFDRKVQPAEALTLYLAVEKSTPESVPLLLKIARQYRHLAAEVILVGEKIRLFEISKSYALRAVKLAPNEAEAHLSVAITYAKMLPLLDSKAKVEAIHKVKAAVDKSLALDAGQDLAWHVLGCWHGRLAEVGAIRRTAAKVLYGEIPEGSSEEAVRCFQKAIKLNPSRLSHYVEMGIAYAFQGNTAKARESLNKGLAMPSVDAGDPASKELAREVLSSLK